jgi:type V secretory pathway adhesin AidA
VRERKLAGLMKKMKENGKLDINKRLTNHSARKYLLQQLRENNVEETDSMHISGHKNVASINIYSKMSEEKHKQI